MSKKQVKIIGLQILKNFGGLKAVNLRFDKKNRLTVVKGEVGAGKTTLKTATSLTTQGSSALTDKNLYGNIDVITQLLDGDTNVFVGCRTNKDNQLSYFLYTVDENGKKIKNPVIDGQKATPGNYLKKLQTELTWRLDELVSDNKTVQRDILLDLYKDKMQSHGVIFDKSHPKYTEGIIHQIEVAKNHRSLMDMKRKEVGGIGDDLRKKGINFENRRTVKDLTPLEKEFNKSKAKISVEEAQHETFKENELGKVKLDAKEVEFQIKEINQQIIKDNTVSSAQLKNLKKIELLVDEMVVESNANKLIKETIKRNLPKTKAIEKEIELVDGKIKSNWKEFKHNNELAKLLKRFKKIQKQWKDLNKPSSQVISKKLQTDSDNAQQKLNSAKIYNKEAEAINSLHNWQEANNAVNEFKDDYYNILTQIDTGVKGLYICTDKNIEDDDNIYLMYDGSYDPDYFHNKKLELRKISAYSGTQKPMICLLIQSYLLSKKDKTLPYLWIDDVPIDNKTRKLLEKMAKELNLWLFVNWTGDFKSSKLKNGEILLEDGKILTKN